MKTRSVVVLLVLFCLLFSSVAFAQTWTLTVQSYHVTGVPITGDKPGTTNYTVACETGQTVTLTAPPTITVSGTARYFAYWATSLGADPESTFPTISTTMDRNRTLLAVYAVARLTVKGPIERGEGPLPASGGKFTVDVYLRDLGVTGGISVAFDFFDRAGESTPFLVSTQDDVQLNTQTLPEPTMFIFISDQVSFDGEHVTYFGDVFSSNTNITDEVWLLSATYTYGPTDPGTYMIMTDPDLSLAGTPEGGIIPFATIPGHLVIALAGDVNGDCTVNITDLILVRNNFGKGSGSNSDVNGDGKVDTADLLFVRDRLDTKCK